MCLKALLAGEEVRRQAFPVTADHVFLAHAGVTALPRVAVEAMRRFAKHGSRESQENPWASSQVTATREAAARLLGSDKREIALLGPTSLGLNLVANGLAWEPRDEVVYYHEDYPANVYPWSNLESRGVKPVPLKPEHPGKITWELIDGAITPRTRLVALASCHFLSGYRIDVDAIGRHLHGQGVLFCVDAIQSLGAFPLSVEHVDFLCADSHKWLLGPVGAGIFYVKASCQKLLQPTLLGSWNVVSPQFVASHDIQFVDGAQRYEPGTLNLPGLVGMQASLKLIVETGIEAIAERILMLRRHLLDAVRPLGYRLYIETVDLDPATTDRERSGIITLTHPDRDMRELARNLKANRIAVSLRENRVGEPFVRVSPHFYNTPQELDRVIALLR